MQNPKSKYEDIKLISQLGYGGFSTVWKAQVKSTNEIVAVKKVSNEYTQKAALEISVLRRCKHKNIIKYFHTFSKDGEIWIIMEYCAGGSLADLIKKKSLNEKQIAYISREVLEGIEFLHSLNIIHRDIKASNILLTEDGQPKISDFGVSVWMSSEEKKQYTQIGTPLWMAPELITKQGYDQKIDIWSFGITLIELAEKNPPYSNLHSVQAVMLISKNPPPQLTANVWSKEFQYFVSLCLIKLPSLRAKAQDLLKESFVKNVKDQSNEIKELISFPLSDSFTVDESKSTLESTVDPDDVLSNHFSYDLHEFDEDEKKDLIIDLGALCEDPSLIQENLAIFKKNEETNQKNEDDEEEHQISIQIPRKIKIDFDLLDKHELQTILEAQTESMQKVIKNIQIKYEEFLKPIQEAIKKK
ncbi:sterile20-like kinase isoform b-related [Anaeramoeba ignava]|uniref:non-specific serine/threonine protein kinase n=1 Tax=Anaeramoeba ignava TaxID=1746090 RepID=A0A9Q0LVE9_ANAIG|nr:sterile20-like kinase isoform b-related [Anaeramoeba ignava]